MASAKLQGTIFAPEDPVRLEAFVDVVDMRPAYSTIALNAPIGNLNQAIAGGRTCDREARALLGRRGASIKSAPVGVDSGADIDLLPDHLDAVSRTLLPRYREVAAEMAPFRQRTIFEVHSDLSFYQLNGDVPLQWSKHSEKGMQERRAPLGGAGPGCAQGSSTPRSQERPYRTFSMPRPFSGPRGGSSPTPPFGSPKTRNGTSRGSGWRCSAESSGTRDLRISAVITAQNVWWVKGRRSSGPANTAKAHPSARNTP